MKENELYIKYHGTVIDINDDKMEICFDKPENIAGLLMTFHINNETRKFAVIGKKIIIKTIVDIKNKLVDARFFIENPV